MVMFRHIVELIIFDTVVVLLNLLPIRCNGKKMQSNTFNKKKERPS